MNKDTTIEELREEARRIYGKTRYSNVFDRAADRIEALERQLAGARAEYLTASKDAMELAGKLNAAEAERDRLAAELAEARAERDALAAFAFWFRKWPEFKPSPEFSAQLQGDLFRAASFIPSDRLASKEASHAE